MAIMSRYVMSSRVILEFCYNMPHHIMSCHVMSCPVMLRHISRCHTMLWHILSCYVPTRVTFNLSIYIPNRKIIKHVISYLSPHLYTDVIFMPLRLFFFKLIKKDSSCSLESILARQHDHPKTW